MPPVHCLSAFSSLSLSHFSQQDPDFDLEHELCSIFPKFESAELDWKHFGYLLNDGISRSSEIKKTNTVFQKPIEPIGKETKRRRRNADMEVIELGKNTFLSFASSLKTSRVRLDQH